MNRLLVSARSVEECRLLLATSVDIIDLKEPQRGSLGAVEPEVIRAVVAELAGQRPLSVALGELATVSDPLLSSLAGVDFAKVGLSGSLDDPRWLDRWTEIVHRLPPTVASVAVAYVDAPLARSVCWEEILLRATQIGCRILLLDTFDKSAGSLGDWISPRQLLEVRRATRDCGLKLALAGSLRCDDLVSLVSVGAEWLAVRSAACEGGRGGRLSQTRVEELLRRLAGDQVLCPK